jgi:uncharacterized membrane protein
MRAMTPLAAVADAARRDALPKDNGAPKILANPLVTAATEALAAGELAGDKMPSAPDRIVVPGLAARVVTGAMAGAALAPREQRIPAAMLGVAGAIGGAYLSFHVRMWALRRYGQVPTGLIEDAAMLAATRWIVSGAPAAVRK